MRELLFKLHLLFFTFLISLASAQNDHGVYDHHLKAFDRAVHLSRYDSLLYHANHLVELSVSDSLAVNILRKSNAYRLLNQKEKAIAMLAVYDSIKHREGTFQFLSDPIRLLHEARILSDFEEASAAAPLFEKAIELIREVNGENSPMMPRFLAARGLNHHRMGDLEQAKKDYELTESICLNYNMVNIDLANVLQNIAIIHTVYGDFDIAMSYFKRSERVRESLFEPLSYQMATFYNNYGRFLSVIGAFSESLDYYFLSEKIQLKQIPVDETALGFVLINIGNIMQIQGDLEKAKMYFQNAFVLLENRLSSSHPAMVFVKNNLGFVYAATGEYLKAKSFYEQSLNTTNDADSKQLLLINLANLYNNLENSDSALYFYKMAKKFSEEVFGRIHYRTATANRELGNYFIGISKPDSALRYFKHAAAIFERTYGPAHTEMGYALLGIAQAHQQLGNYIQAGQNFDKAGLIFDPLIQGFLESGRHGNFFADIRLVNYLAGSASLYLSWFQSDGGVEKLHASLGLLKKGIDLVDLIGLGITDESRMILNQNVRSMLADAMEVCHLLFKHTNNPAFINEAFTFAGRSKAAVLLSSVRKLYALRAGGVPDEITESERKLNEGIAATRKLIFDEQQLEYPNQNRVSYLESRHFKLVREYDSLLNFIEQNYADYYSLRYDNRVVGIAEVQSGLAGDQVLIEYVLGDENMYTFLINNEGVDFIKSVDARSIVQGIETIRQQSQLDFSNHTMLEYKQFLKTSAGLYRGLIGPVAQRLNGKRLLIIPDGILGYLPFEILLPDAPAHPDRIDYNGLPYLLRSHPISYAYSSTLYFSRPSAMQYSGRRLIAIAPDYSFEAIGRVAAPVRNELDLNPLPFAYAEVKQVNQHMGGRILKSAEATKANFLRFAPDYDVLHLAMHAQINDDNPLYSTLIFQPDSDSIASFALSTYELYGMQLNAQLVVLSACNTGSGTLRQGEGVMSLTRGFIFAGVPSIIMTAWEVHDESGALLMSHFYELLSQGYPKDLALQLAKLRFLEHSTQLKSHPYFWSAYVLVGDSSPLPPAKPQLPWFVYFLAAALLIGIVVLPRKKKRRF